MSSSPTQAAAADLAKRPRPAAEASEPAQPAPLKRQAVDKSSSSSEVEASTQAAAAEGPAQAGPSHFEQLSRCIECHDKFANTLRGILSPEKGSGKLVAATLYPLFFPKAFHAFTRGWLFAEGPLRRYAKQLHQTACFTHKRYFDESFDALTERIPTARLAPLLSDTPKHAQALFDDPAVQRYVMTLRAVFREETYLCDHCRMLLRTLGIVNSLDALRMAARDVTHLGFRALLGVLYHDSELRFTLQMVYGVKRSDIREMLFRRPKSVDHGDAPETHDCFYNMTDSFVKRLRNGIDHEVCPPDVKAYVDPDDANTCLWTALYPNAASAFHTAVAIVKDVLNKVRKCTTCPPKFKRVTLPDHINFPPRGSYARICTFLADDTEPLDKDTIRRFHHDEACQLYVRTIHRLVAAAVPGIGCPTCVPGTHLPDAYSDEDSPVLPQTQETVECTKDSDGDPIILKKNAVMTKTELLRVSGDIHCSKFKDVASHLGVAPLVSAIASKVPISLDQIDEEFFFDE